MIPALFFLFCVVALRAATGLLIHSGAAAWLSNFAPLAAVTLCCGAYLPQRYKFALPLSMLFVSDLILNATYHAALFDPQILCRYLALALIGLIGFALRKNASWKTMPAAEQRDEVEMLWLMLLIRRFEERASQQYQAQKIGGFCHLYIGQEAVVTGAVATTRFDDYVITAYRDHAHALARGTSANACMAELFGKDTGCSRGLGGSMHFFDKEHHMYGGHAIVGAHVPLACGLAFACKYRNEDRVTLCFFGDGAINQGSFHEALNLAALFKLPVIFICENNLFAMGTSVERSTS